MINLKSLKTKLILFNSLIISFIILTFSVVIYYGNNYFLLNKIDSQLDDISESIFYKFSQNRPTSRILGEYLESKLKTLSIKPIYVNIYEGGFATKNSQRLLFTSNGDYIFSIDKFSKSSFYSYETVNNIKFRKFTMFKSNFLTTQTVIVATPIDYYNQNVKLFLVFLFIIDSILFLLSFFLGSIITNRTLKPIKEINKKIENISSEKALTTRLEIHGNGDEIDQLATNINKMLEKLENSFSIISQFTSDVAHELKTPLTIINGEVELSLKKERSVEEYKKALLSINREILSLNDIIENLLFLSKTEQNYQTKFEEVSIDGVVLEAFEDATKFASDKSVFLDIKKLDFGVINGNMVLLKRMIFNILNNAIKYSAIKDNGRVCISLFVKDKKAILQIDDNGEGIPKENIPYLFERFYRVSKSRSKKIKGTGLGLAIAKRIVDIHKGKISVSSKVGVGTTFTIELPIK